MALSDALVIVYIQVYIHACMRACAPDLCLCAWVGGWIHQCMDVWLRRWVSAR